MTSGDRQRRLFLHGHQAEVGFDVIDAGEAQDALHGEFREVIHAAGDHFQEEIVGAAHRMAFHDVFLDLNLGEEVALLTVVLLLQAFFATLKRRSSILEANYS